jgi:hypothetical protein
VTQKYPRRHPETAFRAVGDEGGLVVLPGRAEVKVLNPVAIKVFDLLDGRHSAEQIAGKVCEEFEVGEEQALADVRSFIDELESHGMLAEPQAAPAREERG